MEEKKKMSNEKKEDKYEINTKRLKRSLYKKKLKERMENEGKDIGNLGKTRTVTLKEVEWLNIQIVFDFYIEDILYPNFDYYNNRKDFYEDVDMYNKIIEIVNKLYSQLFHSDNYLQLDPEMMIPTRRK